MDSIDLKGADIDPASLVDMGLNDAGIKDRFLARYGHLFRYLDELGWIAFDGTHWRTEHAEHALTRSLAETIARIEDEAEFLQTCDKKKAAKRTFAFAKTGAPQFNRIARCKTGLQSFLVVSGDQFDRDPLALNVQNGTLRFVQDANKKWLVRLDPHQASDMISRICTAPYEAEANAPIWEAHLRRAHPSAEQRRYLQRIEGYCALGTTEAQCFMIFQGRGADGKSTTNNLVRKTLGDYANVADPKLFTGNGQHSGEAATPAIASLAGDTRMVVVSEPCRGSIFNDGLLKQITSGSPISVRRLRRDMFTYTPRFKLIVECNAVPAISGADDGIWRRIRPLIWRVQVPGHLIDTALEVKLDNERPGVLRWIVEGALDYLNSGGLCPPTEARSDFEDLRSGANLFGEWVSDCLIIDKEAVVAQKELIASFESFCQDRTYEPMGARKFLDELTNLQVSRIAKKSSEGRNVLRRGARLRTEADRASSPECAAAPALSDDIPVFDD